MISMDISQYEIVVKRHALVRAMQRGITPDMIEATIKGGTLQRFGKNSEIHQKIQTLYRRLR
jgi:hypothetical protein